MYNVTQVALFYSLFLFPLVYYDHWWIGLRFLRVLVVINLPDVLVYVRVVNSSAAIRLAKIVTLFTAVVSEVLEQRGMSCIC